MITSKKVLNSRLFFLVSFFLGLIAVQNVWASFDCPNAKACIELVYNGEKDTRLNNGEEGLSFNNSGNDTKDIDANHKRCSIPNALTDTQTVTLQKGDKLKILKNGPSADGQGVLGDFCEYYVTKKDGTKVNNGKLALVCLLPDCNL